MPTHVALLRAVNLAGRNMVKMADLCAVFDEVGFPGAKSLLQSGNVVFDAGDRDARGLEKLLEDATARRLGLGTDFMVRTTREWRRIVAVNPFPRQAADDPAHLLVGVLKGTPARGAEARLNAAITGRETARVIGAQVYIHYPDGVGRSKLTPAKIDRALGVHGTARNWNTVLKIGALLG